MYLAVWVGKFVKQDVREWCAWTTRPLLPTIADSPDAPGREVPYKLWCNREAGTGNPPPQKKMGIHPPPPPLRYSGPKTT